MIYVLLRHRQAVPLYDMRREQFDKEGNVPRLKPRGVRKIANIALVTPATLMHHFCYKQDCVSVRAPVGHPPRGRQ